MDEGTVREVEAGYELRFERHLEQPIGEVWEAITEPEHLAEWLGEAEIDLQPGGRIRVAEAGIDGEVIEVEAPRVLSYKWDSAAWGDGGPVRYELSEMPDGGTLLVFTHVQPVEKFEEYRSRTSAHWRALLDLLEQDRGLTPPAWPMEVWQAIPERLARVAVHA